MLSQMITSVGTCQHYVHRIFNYHVGDYHVITSPVSQYGVSNLRNNLDGKTIKNCVGFSVIKRAIR